MSICSLSRYDCQYNGIRTVKCFSLLFTKCIQFLIPPDRTYLVLRNSILKAVVKAFVSLSNVLSNSVKLKKWTMTTWSRFVTCVTHSRYVIVNKIKKLLTYIVDFTTIPKHKNLAFVSQPRMVSSSCSNSAVATLLKGSYISVPPWRPPKRMRLSGSASN